MLTYSSCVTLRATAPCLMPLMVSGDSMNDALLGTATMRAITLWLLRRLGDSGTRQDA